MLVVNEGNICNYFSQWLYRPVVCERVCSCAATGKYVVMNHSRQ